MSSYCVKRFAAAIVSVVLLYGAYGCDSNKKRDEKNPLPSNLPVSSNKSSVPVNTGWDEGSAGRFMLLSSAEDGVSAALVLPGETDSSLARTSAFPIDTFASDPVDLFSSSGSVDRSNIAINSQQPPAEGCLVWPSVRLMTKPREPWTVGFPASRARPIQIRSVERLPPGDSSIVATELARQASALSLNGDPAFRGLPFIVQRAYRLSLGDTTVLVGTIVRKINEEANPREEHLLLILEGNSHSAFSVAYQNKSAGAEDAVRTSSVLAAIRFVSTNRAAIVISFEYDDGGQVALLERVSNRNWRITWRSAYTGC